VWYANARLRHEREAACDAAALESAEGPPRVYGESLLKVLLNARGRSAAVSGFLGIFERDTRLQDRLEAIMDTRRKNRGTGIAGWAFVAVFALVFLPMAGARGTDPSDVSKPKQPASPAKLQEKPAPLAAPETVGAFRADSAALREAASTVEPLKLEFDVIRRFVQEPMRLPEALEALRKARPKFDRFAECVRGTDVEPLVRDALERVAKLEQVLQRGDAGEAKTIVAELGEAGPRIGKKIAELQQKAQPGEPAKATNPVAPQGDSAAGSKGANWSARQATGEPDTATAGDLATAWATLQPDAGEEWLELDYAPPMIANMVRIHETFNPGAVTGVVLLGERGEIFDTVPMNDSTRQAPAFLEVPFKQTTRPVKSVRVMLDTAKVHGWNEIDAVELAGPGGRAWAVDARASSSYADRKPRSRPVGSIATFEELFALNSDIPVNLSWGPTDQPDMLHGKKVRFEVVEMSLDGAPLQVLHAVFDAQIISAPKARWEIACSILDADGNVIARATEKLENSGVIVGVVDISPVIVKILFGGASQMLLEKARKFRIEVSGEVEEVPTPWASVSPVSPEPVPPGATVLGYVGDKEQGRRSIAAGGHAVAFTRPVNVAWVEAIQICASRYGSPQPPDEDFHVYLMNNNKEVIADLKFPYAMIERSDMKWYTLRTPSVEVPGEFLVGLAFNPHQTKGIYLGFDKASGESHSSVGLPDSGYEPGKGGEEWMVRVHVTAQPTNARGTMRLADWKPPVKEEPFKDCVEAKHDDGNSGGMQSYGGRGPAIRFRPADFLPKDKAGAPLALKGIRVYGSRYGSGYDPAKTLIHVTVLDPQNRALGKAEVPYAKFSYRQQWVDLPFENPVNIANPGEELTIAVNPEAHQTKGIYFHYNKNPKESHSSAGTVENGFQPVADREWMIRAHFSQGGGK
jgi:RNA polymerase sigma-70 factor (ECF subfamily)